MDWMGEVGRRLKAGNEKEDEEKVNERVEIEKNERKEKMG